MHLIDFETGISTGRLHEPPTQSEIERFVKECVTGCFVANTKIKTQSGEKEIERMVADKDSVWAYNLIKKEKVLRAVRQVFVKTSKQICKLFLAGSVLLTTPEYKFADNEGNWIAAHNLAGKEIISFSGELVCVERAEIKDSLVQVYNLEVENEHNYFAGGLLAHNNCNCSDLVTLSSLKLKLDKDLHWTEAEINRFVDDLGTADYILKAFKDGILDLDVSKVLVLSSSGVTGKNLRRIQENLATFTKIKNMLPADGNNRFYFRIFLEIL